MNLTNVTQTIAILHTATNSSFDSVRLNLTGASITIDNKTYAVTLLQKVLFVRLLNRTNSSAGGALVDLTPTVIQIYAGNQTLFAMAPSISAIAIGRNVISTLPARIGASHRIENGTLAAIARTRPNITITGASLDATGNTTRLSVTVKNNEGKAAELEHLVLSGGFEALIGASVSNTINTSTVASGITAGDVESVARSLGINDITENTINAVRDEIKRGAGDPLIGTSVLGLYNTSFNSIFSNITNINSTLNSTGYNSMPANSTSINSTLNAVANAMGMNISPSELQHILGVVSSTSQNGIGSSLTASSLQNILGTIETIGALSSVMGSNGAQFGDYQQMLDTVLNFTKNANFSSNQLAEISSRLKNITPESNNATQALAIAGNLNLTQGEASSAVRLLDHYGDIEAVSVFNREYHGVLNFVIDANGTLSLPFIVSGVEAQHGYLLAGNSSTTLVFDGVVALGAHALPTAVSVQNAPMHLRPITVKPIPNSTYVVRVSGTDGALAKANVTAG